MADPNEPESFDETLQNLEPKPKKTPVLQTAPPSQADPLSVWTWPGEDASASLLSQTQSDSSALSVPSSPDNHDATLVNETVSPRRDDTRPPENLDQTLVNPPERGGSDVTYSGQDATLLKPTTGPRRDDTRPPQDLDHTLVNPPERAERGGSDVTYSGQDATLVKPTTGPRREDTRSPADLEYTLVNPAERGAGTDATYSEEDATLLKSPADVIEAPATRGDAALVKPETEIHRKLADTDAPEAGQQDRPTGRPAPTGPMPSSKTHKIPTFRATGDRYDVQGTLGRGGMGVVYKALDTKLNRLVALKMILSGAHASPETLMRFKIEAEAVAKLQHPNIVQIFDIGERDGHPFFSLEYLDGGSLHQKLDGPQQPKHAASVIETLARAMHYAHLHGIVHRDLKPANVLIATDGTLKITDFGLAKQLDAEDSGQTGTEAILGTPTYMAPEQAAGHTKEVGPAADIYALGAMLYEMLTGRPPFRGTTIMETLQQVQFIEPIQPRRLQPNAPLDLQTICLKCLNKEPRKRYASAEALADDLRAYLSDRPIKARPTPVLERMYKWARRRPMDAAVVAISIVAFCGLIYGVIHHIQQQNQLIAKADENTNLAIEKRDAETARADQEKRDHDTIKKKNDDLKNANIEIEAKKTLAENNAQRARANLENARKAVDELTRLGQQGLLDKPGLEKVREQLLTRVVQLHQKFIEDNKDQPESEDLTLDMGQSYRRSGIAQEMLGRNEEAAKSYRGAIARFSALLSTSKNTEDLRRDLAETYLNLWVVEEDLGKQQDVVSLDKAYALATELHKTSNDNPRYLRVLAACCKNYGLGAMKAGNFKEAEKRLKEAQGYLKQAKPAEQNTPTFQQELAHLNLQLGILYANRPKSPETAETDREEATKFYDTALEQLTKLTKQFPDKTAYAKELGNVYTNRGILLQGQSQNEAQESYTDAIQKFTELGKKYPDVPDYRHLLAVNRSNRGDLLGQQKDFAAARTDLEAAAETLRDLVKTFGNRPIYRLELARTYNRLGVILEADRKPELARKNWEDAEKRLEELLKSSSNPQDDSRNELKRSLVFLILSYDRDARVLGDAKRWPEAAAATAQLVELREKMALLFPEDGQQIKSDLASSRRALLGFQVEARNTVEAEKTLASFLRNRNDIPRDWGHFNEVAKLACRFMELAELNDPSGKRELLRESRTLNCLELLRDAIDRNEKIEIGRDDFKTLRNNPEFKQFVAEIESKRKN